MHRKRAADARRLPGNPANPDFTLERYPFYLLAQIDSAYARRMEIALKAAGTDRPGWRVLMTLREKDPSGISEIAERATMKRSTISRVVERMRAAGLVHTAPRASDQRITDVCMLPAGARTLERLIEVASVEYERAFAGFETAELEALIATLQRVRANVRRRATREPGM